MTFITESIRLRILFTFQLNFILYYQLKKITLVNLIIISLPYLVYLLNRYKIGDIKV